MPDSIAMKSRFARRAAIVILVVGLIAAVGIYVTAPPDQEDPLEINSLSLKRSTRQLRVLGGNAAVLSEEFQQWFVGLWHGENLAYTVGSISVGLFLVGRFGVPFLLSFEDPAGNKGTKGE